MVKLSLRVLCQIGLDFFEFLNETDRTSIKKRSQLKDIYNLEFRTRNAGIKDPNFSSVVYALKEYNKVQLRRDTIVFDSKVKSLYLDQWHTPRNQRPQPDQNGAASPETIQVVSAADDAETGVRARRKLASLLMIKLQAERNQFISDKHGVSITSDTPFNNGILSLCVENTFEYAIKLSVKNTGKQLVYFTYYTPLHWLKCLKLHDEQRVTKLNPLQLKAGDSYEIQVQFQCSEVGFYPATLAFEFKQDLQSSSAAFYIVRSIETQCITSLGRMLAPVSPYKPRSPLAWTADRECKIVDGQRPEGYYFICTAVK
ncbi:putative helicase mov-10-B.2 [Xenentodon cancila]